MCSVGNHFSLDGNCPMVKNHSQELNKVKQAIGNGDLNYNTQLKQIKKSNEYQYDVNAFPPLIKMDRNIENRWNTQKTDSNNNINKNEVADVLKEINKNLEMMNKKLDNQKRTIGRNEENIRLNKLVTSELLTTMANLMGEVVLPLLKLVTKGEEVMIKKTEGYAKSLISMEKNLRLNYKFDIVTVTDETNYIISSSLSETVKVNPNPVPTSKDKHLSTRVRSKMNPLAPVFLPSFLNNSLEIAKQRMIHCKIPEKTRNNVTKLLSEWYSSSTLDNILREWESLGTRNSRSFKVNIFP
ncbi:unnamed protein product [Didymodactylos carnosus]|uniref:Uncharacterized protein n=1 Tax=Didymodactylos carnosus TaxID=1234261 RepID=A0A8S2FBG4_9BILA|nr:unnamed protein product [Didymodactylos carnosus]CAF4215836.1 unnamed protein product [Didymodactylos carnosus]